MHNKINALPIILDRKATIYEGVGDGDTDIFIDFDSDDPVTLTSDGSNVEYCLSPFFDERRLPFTELQIDLDISIREFLEYTDDEDTFVNLVLISPNKVGVSITTQYDVIYDEVHTVR